MKSELYYIIPLLLLLVTFIIVFFEGSRKKVVANRVLKFIPLSSVLVFILSSLMITEYYKEDLKREKENFSKISRIDILRDSISLSEKDKSQLIDSIEKLKDNYKLLLGKVKKQEKTIGEYSNFKESISNRIKELDTALTKVKYENRKAKTYNELIDTNIFPGPGFISNKTTDDFTLICPSDTTSEYIDVSIVFKDSNLINNISAIMIIEAQTLPDGTHRYRTNQIERVYYEPRNGENRFRVKNYLKFPKSYLVVGYILKSDLEKKDIPWYNKVCFNPFK